MKDECKKTPISVLRTTVNRKRSRHDKESPMDKPLETDDRGAQDSRTTIHMGGSRRPRPRQMLWRLPLVLGIVSVGTVTTATTAAATNDRLLQETRILNAKNRSLEAYDCPVDDSGCQKVIVSFASGYGNTDPEFGTSDFVRTNARAMCVSQNLLNSLLSSDEVLAVDCDAPVTNAAFETTFENGEAVPWGADLVLQSQWDKIPDPDPNADPFIMCIVDSGLLVRHQDIPFSEGGSNIEGAEFGLLSPQAKWHNPVFYAYHGTHIAGIGFAEGFNGEGLRGVIPRSANFKLLVARVFGDEMIPSASTSTIEMAVEWCADKGAKVINLSLASATPTLNSQRLYERMVTREDVFVVAASGNRGTNEDSYPAAYDHVVSVGAIGKDMKRSQFSQYGPTLGLVAPGEAFSTVPKSGIIDNESTQLDAGPMAFTPVPNDLIEGDLFYCENGATVCVGATDQVCLVEHLSSLGLSFRTIAQNCEDGGGIGLILFPGIGEDLEGAHMDLSYSGSISVLTVVRDIGLRLEAKRGTQASISFTVPAYRTVDGTSMAAAHVSALAAKLWAARPGCTNTQIREALEGTALDLGDEGRDDMYGYGLVHGAAAYDFLLDQPPPCGTPEGSGGFLLDGTPAQTLTLKTPHADGHKTRICDPSMNPFCGNGPGGISIETQGSRRLRGGRS